MQALDGVAHHQQPEHGRHQRQGDPAEHLPTGGVLDRRHLVEHAEDEAGQTRLGQVEADTDVPAADDTEIKPDIVTEDDCSGVAGGASGSSSGGSGLPGHPDATR